VKTEAPTRWAEATATGDIVQEGPDTPPVIAEVVAYRRAPRRLVRDLARSTIQVCVSLINLAAHARREAESPELCQAGIWAESKRFLDTGEQPLDREAIVEALAWTNPVDLAQRRLLRDGYADCPTCLRHLPDERSLDHQRKLARQSLQEALAFEEAI
jgi:hypothetical protein